MRNSHNQCQFLGNVGGNPDIRFTKNGTKVAVFSLAVENNRLINGEWEDGTQWVNLQAFGKIAETVEKHIRKGAGLLVQARYSSNRTEIDGETRYFHNFTVYDLNIVRWPDRDDDDNDYDDEEDEYEYYDEDVAPF